MTRMAAARIVSSKIDKRSKLVGRKNDRLGGPRTNGYASYLYQPIRGKNYKAAPFGSKLNVRKNLGKPYGRSNLSIINRRYYNRGAGYLTRNIRKQGIKFEKIANGNIGRREFQPRKVTVSSGFRGNNRRGVFRNNRRRNFGFRRMNVRNVHSKVGKLSSKDLDAELDSYMGANNVKSRLDNDLDSYFKNNAAAAQPMESKN